MTNCPGRSEIPGHFWNDSDSTEKQKSGFPTVKASESERCTSWLRLPDSPEMCASA